MRQDIHVLYIFIAISKLSSKEREKMCICVYVSVCLSFCLSAHVFLNDLTEEIEFLVSV